MQTVINALSHLINVHVGYVCTLAVLWFSCIACNCSLFIWSTNTTLV